MHKSVTKHSLLDIKILACIKNNVLPVSCRELRKLMVLLFLGICIHLKKKKKITYRGKKKKKP